MRFLYSKSGNSRIKDIIRNDTKMGGEISMEISKFVLKFQFISFTISTLAENKSQNISLTLSISENEIRELRSFWCSLL